MGIFRLFQDRVDAGRQLARELQGYREQAPLVLGLPRGGVPVAAMVARELRVPLDIWVVRKVGAPFQPELGIGAVAEGDEVFVDKVTAGLIGASPEEVEQIVAQKKAEVAERAKLFRHGHLPPDVRDRTVIVVDDGIATGGTVRVAVRALRKRGAKRIVLAVPVASSQALESIRAEVDEVVCLHSDPNLMAIGLWYQDFSQTSDEEVIKYLGRKHASGGHQKSARTEAANAVSEQRVKIPAGNRQLEGILRVPGNAAGVIAFAHGSGSGRYSPRNQFVARILNEAAIATLLLDLLEEEEAQDRSKVFDIELLAQRLEFAATWLARATETQGLPRGYFGASTGAAAALVAAARNPDSVVAIVSRGGRPDLAAEALPTVTAPTLLIVGGNDDVVLDLNRQAFDRLRCTKELVVIPHATHLFPEPGALEEVAELATQWFVRFLTSSLCQPASRGSAQPQP